MAVVSVVEVEAISAASSLQSETGSHVASVDSVVAVASGSTVSVAVSVTVSVTVVSATATSVTVVSVVDVSVVVSVLVVPVLASATVTHESSTHESSVSSSESSDALVVVVVWRAVVGVVVVVVVVAGASGGGGRRGPASSHRSRPSSERAEAADRSHLVRRPERPAPAEEHREHAQEGECDDGAYRGRPAGTGCSTSHEIPLRTPHGGGAYRDGRAGRPALHSGWAPSPVVPGPERRYRNEVTKRRPPA